MGIEGTMTRICDNCKKTIPLGTNHIEVKYIGMKDVEALFKTNQLDFCKLECLVEFWANYKGDK